MSNSQPAVEVLVSHEGLCSMDFVTQTILKNIFNKLMCYDYYNVYTRAFKSNTTVGGQI